MAAFRRRLALGALALTLLQLAPLFASLSCCLPFRMPSTELRPGKADATKVGQAETAKPEECPLHKSKELGSTSKTPDSHCRMMCDAPHGPQFLLGAIGVLPAPRSTQMELASSALPAAAALGTTARPAVPDAPPPRLL